MSDDLPCKMLKLMNKFLYDYVPPDLDVKTFYRNAMACSLRYVSITHLDTKKLNTTIDL